MALEIGAGITLGGGISLVVESAGGGGATPNTFTVEEFVYDANSTYNGASTISGFTFGTLTSDYIEGIYLYRAASTNNQDGYTFIRPKDGTYSGFTIAGGGLIDGDTPSYPRNFIVNGTTYRFHCDGYQYFLRTGDPIQLQGSPGETFPITYDPNNQPSITPNTMFVETYTYYTSYHGANTDIAGLVQGELFSDYFKSIVYTNSNGLTTIIMKDGSYTGFSVSGGSIDGDTSAATRYFDINGANVQLEYSSGAYTVSTDVFNLQTAAGTSVSVVYDPAAQGGGGGAGAFTDGDAYTYNVDWANGNAFQITGNPSQYKVRIDGQFWDVQTGFNALYALTTGDRFKINTYLSDGMTQGDSIITLTSGWVNQFLTMYEANITLSVEVQTNAQINSVTLEGQAPVTYAPQYTSDPGGAPWPTTADYGYVSYHDMFGVTVKGMTSTSDLYAFFSAATTGDTFIVTFSGTEYTFTLVDYNSGTVLYTESDGPNTYYTVNLPSFFASVSPSLSAGEGATLYGTLISGLPGAGGNPNLFTAGDGTTVSITTSVGASGRVTIVTNGSQAVLTSSSWTAGQTATLTGTGGPAVITFDYMNNENDNGDGTWTYEIAILEYPPSQTWDSIELTA